MLGLALVVSLCAASTESARALEPGDDLRRLTYRFWDTEDGLPQETVSAIAQTPDGYLWLGTHGGLVRTDGVRFVVFDRQRGNISGSPWINDLTVDSDGGLWVASNEGLHRYADGRFERFDERFGIPGERVLGVVVDREGLWFGTYTGKLGHWDGENVRLWTSEDGLPRGSIGRAIEKVGDTLWFGTWGSGLWRVVDGELERIALVEGVFSAGAIEQDPRGGLWVGTDVGLFHLDGETVRRYGTADGLASDMAQSLLADRDGNLWVGTYGGGLHRLRRRADGDVRIDRFVHGREVTRRQIWELFEDREGHLWIGSFGGGLERLGDALIEAVGPVDGVFRQINAVYPDADGCLWMATAVDGVQRRCPDGETRTLGLADGLPAAGAWTLTRDLRGDLWIATMSGLARYRDGEMRVFGRADGMPSEVVVSLLPSRDGGLWVGSNGGLSKVVDGRIETMDPRRLPSPLVRAMLEEEDGGLWVGTAGGGLIHLAAEGPGKDRLYGLEEGLPSRIVWSLHRDRRGVLWIGTAGGLARFVDGALRSLNGNQGLVPESISYMIDDERGDLWLGTPAGLLRLERGTLDAYFAGEADSVLALRYGTAEGMASTECIGGVQPATARTADGRLWFPTLGGVAVVDPERMTVRSAGPEPMIEEVLVDGVLHTDLDALSLPAGTRRLELRYTAPSAHAPRRLRFRHRLVGFEESWVGGGHERSTSYTNLPPSHYTFEVAARHEGGRWSKVASIDFRIEPRFYETRSFLAAALVSTGLLLLAGHRLHVRQLRRRQEDLRRQVDDALARLKVLGGLLPICASCKKVRDDRGYWNQIESYISEHSEAEFSHGFCPDCEVRYFERFEEDFADLGYGDAASEP